MGNDTAFEAFKLTPQEMAEIAGEGSPPPAGTPLVQDGQQAQGMDGQQQAPPDGGQAQTLPDGGQQAQEVQRKLVPLEALHEARMEAKEVKAQLAEAQRRIDQLAALKADIDAIRAEKQKASELERMSKVPDPNADPIGYNKWALEQQAKELGELREHAVATSQEREAQDIQRQIVSAVVAKEREFATKTPDYNAAVEYMKGFRKAELEEYGITDPVAVQNEIAQNAFQFSAAALQMGKNPAELMYSLAKRYGYKPAAPAGNGQPPMLGVDTLGTVQAGQQAAGRSLSQAGGVPPVAGGAAEALVKINDPVEFEKAWQRLFGGK